MKTETLSPKLPKTLRLELDGLKDLFHALEHELITIQIDDALDSRTRQKLAAADRTARQLYTKLFGADRKDYAIVYTRKKTRRKTLLELQLFPSRRA